MKLKDFIYESVYYETQREFSKAIGWPQQKISNFINENSFPTIFEIMDIEKMTAGMVSFKDWIPESKKDLQVEEVQDTHEQGDKDDHNNLSDPIVPEKVEELA